MRGFCEGVCLHLLDLALARSSLCLIRPPSTMGGVHHDSQRWLTMFQPSSVLRWRDGVHRTIGLKWCRQLPCKAEGAMRHKFSDMDCVGVGLALAKSSSGVRVGRGLRSLACPSCETCPMSRTSRPNIQTTIEVFLYTRPET